MPKPPIPGCPPVPRNRRLTKETRDYAIQLMTPLFGGGVEAGKPDPMFPIRGTSIRGQLRTWWRIAYGYSLGDGMWQREEEVFGSTEFPSALTINVLDQPIVQMVDPDYGDRFGPIAYALFAAVENKQKVAKEGGVFRLQLSWNDKTGLANRRAAQNEQRRKDRKPPLPAVINDISADVEVALRAWVTFGGIGARTRRGCGAVFCEHLGQSSLPSIPGKILLGQPHATALEAWKHSLRVYQSFRQSPRGKTHAKTIQTRNGPKTIQVPGRSHWPEADSIRQITGCSLKPARETPNGQPPADENANDHSTPVVPSEVLPAFPKAMLGLPINFHFAADGPGKSAPGSANKDPQGVQLVAVAPDASGALQRLDRMASPIITRPLRIDAKWHPAVVILDRHTPHGLQFRLEGKKAKAGGGDVSHDVSMDRVVNPSLGILRPLRGKPSAVDALVDYLFANGFTEVTP